MKDKFDKIYKNIEIEICGILRICKELNMRLKVRK